MNSTEEKRICLTRYGIKGSPDECLLTYTADWCTPCNNIKPFIDEMIKKEHIQLIFSQKVKKSDLPEGTKIPLFKIVNTESFSVIKTIQSSKREDIANFLDFPTLQTDNDF